MVFDDKTNKRVKKKSYILKAKNIGVDPHYKLSIPLNTAGTFRNDLTTKDDVPVGDDEEFMKTHQQTLVKLMRELSRFKKK